MRPRGDRPARVAERIREEISGILQHRASDPGFRKVTVTDVTVTPDLKMARIHYSVLGEEADRTAAREALRRSRGYLRHELGRALALRYVPEIEFRYDDSYDRGARIDRLLAEVLPEEEPGAE